VMGLRGGGREGGRLGGKESRDIEYPLVARWGYARSHCQYFSERNEAQ
jgi:hypothetical protein